MSSFVYILQSLKDGKYYIGNTGDLNRRLAEHNSGKTKSTKNHIPFELKFSQEFKSKDSAVKIELKLKKWKNRKIIEQIIKDREIKAK